MRVFAGPRIGTRLGCHNFRGSRREFLFLGTVREAWPRREHLYNIVFTGPNVGNRTIKSCAGNKSEQPLRGRCYETGSDFALAAELYDARARTDEMFWLLDPAALYERPAPERHRLIFYLGHLEAFDWNQICRGALETTAFHSMFDKLFEFGIDPEPGQSPADRPSDWPRVEEVARYNAEVRRRVDESLARAPAQIVQVALEHRLMHAETFAYLMHELPYERKLRRAAHAVRQDSGPPPEARMVDIAEGEATLGQDPAAFGWDNEFARHRMRVPSFRMARYKVTNGEYLRFVMEGAAAPHFWVRQGEQWFYRGMFGLRPLPLDWPVYVTHEEAAAYAAWRAKSLPSEEQFHRAAYGSPDGGERAYPWGGAAPGPRRGNFNFRRWDPEPVTAHPAGESAFGIAQLAGNGWEWTSTRFGPFPGFEPFPFYPGYSANFFASPHFVLKGGSPRTARRLLRRSFRNWFRPCYPYVYATFRLVENG
ncbi:MAG: SUMF1/EgtB/PvdO family nonheme iron enzyme [Acidobacteria bacterium]|nr:SUMF1/EgtB/PvdO family nonheme iron enzyme [Acidobacteriota bacterium]